MTLSAGDRLGPYQIVAPIGAGGMGEVYRARDTKLGRDVAIKTLPAETASDPDRRARFEQEARAASALNHPNIVTIHDIDSANGSLYIAMELVEGRTLRELTAAGPLPARKLLEIATQIADGLAKAHAAGIVHRVLKPDNVMVSKDGFVKVLDFGLAKLVGPAVSDLSELPTRPATSPGAVLGTVGYMSPEQAAGLSADFRSDQFALGSILYEMASGQRAFRRATGAETLAAIIRDEPEDLATANPRLPAPVRWIVERCLAKDPDDRFASTRDLARDLASIRDHLSETSSSLTASPPATHARLRWKAAAAALAALAFALAAGVFLGRRGAPPDAEFTELLTYRRGAVMTARFAPDGHNVVYGAAWEGQPLEVYTARIGTPETRPLGLPPGDLLAVSSTGELAISMGRRFTIGWESTGTLARVPLAGGAPRAVMENVHDADWSPDGATFAIARDVGRTRRVEFPPGTVLHETSGWISRPRVSRDARHVAFFDLRSRGDSLGRLAVVGTDGKARTLVESTASTAGLAWSPGGDEVWFGGRNRLSAIDLEGRVRALTGTGPTSLHLHDVASDGRLLVAATNRRREMTGLAPGETRERNLTWLDWTFPEDISDDGRTVVFSEQNWIVNGNTVAHARPTDGGLAVRLGECSFGTLSPDGRWVACVRTAGEQRTVLLLPTGAGEHRALGTGLTQVLGASWFRDGQRLLVVAADGGRVAAYVAPLEGGQARSITPEGIADQAGTGVSADGSQFIATALAGTLSVYPVDGGEPRDVPGTLPGDSALRWLPDSRRIFVQRSQSVPAAIDVLDTLTGERYPFKTLVPPDPAGVLAIWPVLLTPDGSSYVYSYRRLSDALWVVGGVR